MRFLFFISGFCLSLKSAVPSLLLFLIYTLVCSLIITHSDLHACLATGEKHHREIRKAFYISLSFSLPISFWYYSRMDWKYQQQQKIIEQMKFGLCAPKVIWYVTGYLVYYYRYETLCGQLWKSQKKGQSEPERRLRQAVDMVFEKPQGLDYQAVKRCNVYSVMCRGQLS